MRDYYAIRAVVEQCTYPGFEWILVEQNGTLWFQLRCPDGEDTATGEAMDWKGRKWIISKHSTDTEIVQTVWAAVQRALLHEASELFRFKGQPIFDRHINVHMLADLRANEPDVLDGRPLP